MTVRSRFTPPAQSTNPATGEVMTYCQRCDRYFVGADLVHVDGVGHVPGKRAEDLRAGDVLLHSYGHYSRVRSVTQASKCYLGLTTASVARGEVQLHTRRVKPSTLIPVVTSSNLIAQAVATGKLPA